MKLNHYSSVGFAVFNCSEYDCRKGREAVRSTFGDAAWRRVKSRMRSGIMEIFHYSPTRETLLYVNTVASLADNRAVRTAATPPQQKPEPRHKQQPAATD